MNLGKIIIKNEQDILSVRQGVKILAQRLGFDYLDMVRMTTAASELTRNIQEHAESGSVSFEIITKNNRTGIKLVFQDKGKGIIDIKKVLRENYQSAEGMGIGLRGAKKLMDDFEIASEIGKGTKIAVTKWIKSEKVLSSGKLEQIKQEFTLTAKASDIEELKSQNRELITVLEIIGDKNNQLALLNQELEKTNNGILALYQEIDKKNEELSLYSERKSNFMRSLAHETRTPIISVLSLLNLLLGQKDGPLNDEQLLQAKMIKENAEYLLNLINDLLDLSKIEEGYAEYIISEISIEELLHDVKNVLSPLAQEKGLELKFQLSEKLPPLETDKKYLIQVLLNILGNAIKYTDRGRVELQVELMEIKGLPFFEFHIMDTGIGIPGNKLDMIFQQFQRVYSRDDIRKGSGLGLYIAKTIVENLGGKIAVTSEEGVGSTFTFTIPLANPLLQKKQISEKKERKAINKNTILIVEDDEKVIHFLRNNLNKAGFETYIARSAEKAIDLIQRYQFFTVCLDLLLPKEKDGWKVLKTIKHNLKYKNVPVVVITVLHQRKEKAYSLGADGFFKKPINMDDLVLTLNSYKKVHQLESILLIDDEKAVQLTFKKYFEDKYKINIANDGKEALQMLKKITPDLIILDLIMPVMDGFEFLEKIKKNKKLEHIPVFIYSSKELTEKEEDVLEQNFVIHINKNETRIDELPLKLKTLFHNISQGV